MLLGGCGAAPAEAPAGPWLVALGPDRVGVGLATDEKAPVLEWWPDRAFDVPARTVPLAEAAPGLFTAVVEGLPAGPVSYRVRTAGTAPAPRVFRAAPPIDAHVRFAAFGDTRPGDAYVHRAVVDAVVRQRPDFVIHTGEMVGDAGERADWDAFLRDEQPLISRAPLLVAPARRDLGPWFDRLFFRDRWPDGWYARDFGRVRVVGLDVARACVPRCGWWDGPEAALAEGRDRHQLLVLVLHDAPYSSGVHGSDRDLRAVVAPIAAAHGVSLVLSGEDHDYERTKRQDGVTYVVTGAAGGPVHRTDPRHFSAAVRSAPHYVVVDADPAGLALRAYDLDGAMIDQVLLPGPTP
jgi:hypothetical protein